MRKLLSLAAIAVLLISACNQGAKFEENENGLMYKIYDVAVDENDRTPVDGDIITAAITYGTEDTTFYVMPEPQAMMLPPVAYPGDLWEGVAMMTTGDSAVFVLDAEDFFRKTLGFRGEALPFELDSTSRIQCAIYITEIMDQETAQQKHEEELAVKENEELAMLSTYLKENNITATPTENGMYFIRTKEGKGAKAENGKTMVMHYTGKFLDGSKFDSSLDRGTPFEFPLGQGRVIKGWDQGVAMMNVGDKATFIIPSSLGYGSQDRGPIPAYSTLIFDVELVDVK